MTMISSVIGNISYLETDYVAAKLIFWVMYDNAPVKPVRQYTCDLQDCQMQDCFLFVCFCRKQPLSFKPEKNQWLKCEEEVHKEGDCIT